MAYKHPSNQRADEQYRFNRDVVRPWERGQKLNEILSNQRQANLDAKMNHYNATHAPYNPQNPQSYGEGGNSSGGSGGVQGPGVKGWTVLLTIIGTIILWAQGNNFWGSVVIAFLLSGILVCSLCGIGYLIGRFFAAVGRLFRGR